MKKNAMSLKWLGMCSAFAFLAACQSSPQTQQTPAAPQEVEESNEEEGSADESAPEPTYCSPEQVEGGNCNNEVALEPASESAETAKSETESTPVAVQEQAEVASEVPVAVEEKAVEPATSLAIEQNAEVPAAPLAEQLEAPVENFQEVAVVPPEAQQNALQDLLSEEGAAPSVAP